MFDCIGADPTLTHKPTMKEGVVGTATTVLLTICAVVVTGLLIRREFAPQRDPSGAPRTITNWQAYRAGQSLTPEGAPVSLTVFSDYECPACRSLFLTLDSVVKRQPTQLSVYYRNIPIATHRHARAAAYAAECAGRVGRFAAAHRLLFTEAESIGVRSWGRFASRISVADTAKFASCIRDSIPASIVQKDESDGRLLRIKATPTLLLDDVLIEGAPSVEQLEELIAKRRSK